MSTQGVFTSNNGNGRGGVLAAILVIVAGMNLLLAFLRPVGGSQQ